MSEKHYSRLLFSVSKKVFEQLMEAYRDDPGDTTAGELALELYLVLKFNYPDLKWTVPNATITPVGITCTPGSCPMSYSFICSLNDEKFCGSYSIGVCTICGQLFKSYYYYRPTGSDHIREPISLEEAEKLLEEYGKLDRLDRIKSFGVQ